MTLSETQVKEIVTELRSDGYDVGLRDVAYAVLASVFGADRHLGFRAVFGDSPAVPFDTYDHLEKTNKVEIAVIHALHGDVPEDDDDSVSFDELKQGLIDDMRALEKLRDMEDQDGHPVLDAREMAQVVAKITDIRVKLTEKFGTTERVVEQRVVVEQKFSAICSYCGHEIAPPPGEK